MVTKQFHFYKKNNQSGVTLIELIIVVGIVSLVSTILMFNYSDFRGNISLRNLSQEVGLSIRKAQTYATSVQSINDTSLNATVFPSYGVSLSFDGGDDTMPSDKRFVLFADIPESGQTTGDKIYKSDGQCGNMQPGSECVEVFTIATSDRIVKLCTTERGCIESGTINIIFTRPAPDAYICIQNGADCNDIASNIDIYIESAQGQTRAVRVWNTGQISIQ